MQIRVTVFATAADKNEADAVAAAVLKAARAESAFYPTVRLETRENVHPAYENTEEIEEEVEEEYVTQDELATGKGFLDKVFGGN